MSTFDAKGAVPAPDGGSPSASTAPRRPWHDPAWRMTALTGTLLVGALVLGLDARGDGSRAASVALAVAVLPLLAALLGPGLVQRLRGADGAVLLSALPILALPPLAFAAEWVTGYRIPELFVVASLLALCGLVLVSYDLHGRAQRAGVRADRSPWQQLTAAERARALPWRLVVGVLLIGCAAWMALTAIAPYAWFLGHSSLLDLGGTRLLGIGAIAFAALVLVGLPLVVGTMATGDRHRLARAREEERARVAAHLHDSVLQTLSLVQRQAGDPAAVTRIARQQERALRAWLAGQPESGEDTLAGALHAVIEEVEGEQSVEVEATVLGDRPLDARGEALAAATREALRNAARHAPGAAIVVFAELGPDGSEVYVRDEGPGFDLEAIPPRRRGVRDSILARMASVGGSAMIESGIGEGTEVALRLPAAGRGPR